MKHLNTEEKVVPKGVLKEQKNHKLLGKRKEKLFKREYIKDSLGVDFSRSANSMENLFKALADPNSSINKGAVDYTPYAMPTYRNDFIKLESFIPRNKNRLRYRMSIPREVYIKWFAKDKKRQEEREKVFTTKSSAILYIKRLEKEHIEYVKAKYDKYFKTRSY
jgi:hypothetical protein